MTNRKRNCCCSGLLIGLIMLGPAILPPEIRAEEFWQKLTGGDCKGGKIAPQIDRIRRAGNPHAVAKYAIPSETKHYDGYYVGGGAGRKGDMRLPHEGTWGFDYFGGLFKRKVQLNWWHGRRDQDGGGSYTTDGPHWKPHSYRGSSVHPPDAVE